MRRSSSLYTSHTVWSLCWALIGMQLVNLQINKSKKENPNLSLAKSGKQTFVWRGVLAMKVSCCYCTFLSGRLCTFYRIGYPILLHNLHGCFLWSEDSKVRQVSLSCEKCSFSLAYLCLHMVSRNCSHYLLQCLKSERYIRSFKISSFRVK